MRREGGGEEGEEGGGEEGEEGGRRGGRGKTDREKKRKGRKGGGKLNGRKRGRNRGWFICWISGVHLKYCASSAELGIDWTNRKSSKFRGSLGSR